MRELTIEDIRATVSYNADTGILTYLKDGKVVDNRNSLGYVRVFIKGKRYLAHRVAWALYNGIIPADKTEIDHLDNNKANNAIENLRLTDSRGNKMNKRLQANNTTGVNGVSFDKRANKYEVSVKIYGRKIYIGHYEDLEVAYIARKAVDRVLNFSEKHGLAIG